MLSTTCFHPKIDPSQGSGVDLVLTDPTGREYSATLDPEDGFDLALGMENLGNFAMREKRMDPTTRSPQS